MAVSSEFLDLVMDLLSSLEGATARPMFGGVGLFLDGLMFGLISAEDRFYLRVDDTNRPAFENAGTSPFRPRAGKSFTMPYWEVPADALEDGDLVTAWARDAWDAAKRQKKTPGKK